MFDIFAPQILGFLDRFSLKVCDIKFQGNPSSGSRADTDGQTDNEANKRLLPLGEGYRSSQPSLDVSKGNGLEINAEKTTGVLLSP